MLLFIEERKRMRTKKTRKQSSKRLAAFVFMHMLPSRKKTSMHHVVRYKDKNYNFGKKVVCEALCKEFRKKL